MTATVQVKKSSCDIFGVDSTPREGLLAGTAADSAGLTPLASCISSLGVWPELLTTFWVSDCEADHGKCSFNLALTIESLSLKPISMKADLLRDTVLETV